jgi:hypothetical protein
MYHRRMFSTIPPTGPGPDLQAIFDELDALDRLRTPESP